MKYFSLFFILSFSQILLAQHPSAGNILTYANGMFNERIEAQKNLDKFRVAFIQKYPHVKIHASMLLYNTNEAAMFQLYEVFQQYSANTLESFWSKMSDIYESAYDDVKYSISDRAAHDADLSKQIEFYKSQLIFGSRIVTVAHSQGNFYTLEALRLVGTPLTKMISIATPASEVYGQGPYFTFKTDKIGKFTPFSLKPNLDKKTTSLNDHGFWTHYMQDANASSLIFKAVETAFTEKHPESWF